MKITNEELLEIIGEENIAHAMKERLDNMQKGAAAELALLQTATDQHAADLGAGLICICIACCEDRLNKILGHIRSLKGRLEAASDALVDGGLNRAERRRTRNRQSRVCP